MFKIGDRVICINNKELCSLDNINTISSKPELKLYKQYIVSDINYYNEFEKENTIRLEGYNGWNDDFNTRRFISLKEYRKQKLNNINYDIK